MTRSNKDDRMHDVPHGFGDDPRAKLLRRRPRDATLSWVEHLLGRPVRSVRARRGGSSSAIHSLRLEGAGPPSVILRSYVCAEVVAEEPDIVQREARVLETLERSPLPTPAFLGADPEGRHAEVPALVMSRLAGRLDWSPTDMTTWLVRLAEVLPVLHQTEVTVSDRVEPFRPYEPASWSPPPFLRRPALWNRALQVFHDPPMDPERVFIHRDYHPGNVLWLRGRVSGVVDWQAASLGPRSVDVFHCRANLLDRIGPEVADRFISVWEEVSGSSYHPWAEVVMLVDALGWVPGGDDPRIGPALEDALARRLAELGR